jgi:hypothetical protein
LTSAQRQNTFTLTAGWNWISFTVLPADLSLNSVFSSILSQVEQVKAQTQSAIYRNGGWKGDLVDMSGIGPGKMFKVKVNQACTLTVSGTAIASATPIHLVGGWNWVAYLPGTVLNLTPALATINGQVLAVKSLTQSATYSAGLWSGTLNQMEPGKGYAIRVSAPMVLVYPTPQLTDYAKATLKYFTSSKANNKITGFTHAFYGPPQKFREYKNGSWQEVGWDLTRGYGSHVNINEVTLKFLCLAVGYKMGWIQTPDGYADSWGQIKTGLETLRSMQTSGDPMQFYQGHFHRAYWTTIQRIQGFPDVDRTAKETVRDSNNIQSSDDNALPYMNLLILEGLANDSAVNIPDKASIITLCQQIRNAIDLRSFVVDNKIVHEYANGSPSPGIWDRISAEGPIILAAMYLANQINETEFNTIKASLLKRSVNWNGQINIDKASYHSAMFIHGLRMIHGLPVTDEEYPGLNYFDTSTQPVTAAQINFADTNSFSALGTQVMTQTFLGYPVFYKISPGSEQAQFAGNESNTMPVYGASLSRATGPHAWFIALARSNRLDTTTVNKMLGYMSLYQGNFFHNGSDPDNDLGWEATIPWSPTDDTYSWLATYPDGQRKYSDWGRTYEALNAAYIVLSTFDALNQDKPLASYSVQAELLKRIADNLDNGSSISSPPPKIASFSPAIGTAETTVVIKGYNFTNASTVTIGGFNVQSFHVDSDVQITALIGVLAVTGKIMVATPNGTFTSKETLTMPPAITVTAPNGSETWRRGETGPAHGR